MEDLNVPHIVITAIRQSQGLCELPVGTYTCQVRGASRQTKSVMTILSLNTSSHFDSDMTAV